MKPTNEMSAEERCPYCSSRKIKPISSKQKDWRGEYFIMECFDCERTWNEYQAGVFARQYLKPQEKGDG